MSVIEEPSVHNKAQELIQKEILSMLEQDYTDTAIIHSFSERGVPYSLANKLLQKAKAQRSISASAAQAKPVMVSHAVAQVQAPVDTPENVSSDFINIHVGTPVTVPVTDITDLAAQVLNTVKSSEPQTGNVSWPEAQTTTQQPVHTAHLLAPVAVDNNYNGFTAGYPNPISSGHPTTMNVKGRNITVTMIKRSPDVIIFDNVLTAQECNELIEYARAKMLPSNVVDKDTGNSVKHSARSSSGAMFRKADTMLLRWMEEFASELLKWPYENSEGYQILNYQVGQEYKPHYDHFDPNTPSGKVIAESAAGNRVATLLFYLNDTEEGGGTDFPNMQITIMPKMGRLAYFSFPDIRNASAVLHAGLPPTKGEKWVAVNWFRQGKYSS